MLAHDLDHDVGGGGDAFGVISAVREGRLNERPEAAGDAEQRTGCVPILNVGRMGMELDCAPGGLSSGHRREAP